VKGWMIMNNNQKRDIQFCSGTTASKDIDKNTKQLYLELQKGIDDITYGNTRPFAEAMADIKSKRNKSLWYPQTLTPHCPYPIIRTECYALLQAKNACAAAQASQKQHRFSPFEPTDNYTYIISNKVENSNNNIYGLERIGGIASVNHGTISDCSVEGNIKPYSNSTVGYFGGLCGINYSKILSSSSFAEISVQNNSADTFYYVAGLSGYNKGIINNSSAYANEYKVDDSTNNIFISGLVACNEGQISLSVAEVEQIGSVKNNVYVAGLVVYNNGGAISGCFAFGNLSGYQVAGIVHTSTNKGTMLFL